MKFEFPDFIGNWQAGRVGKKIGTEAVRTRELIKELDEKFPDLREPKVMDPALRSLLEQKVAEGRMTQEEFDAELRKYEEPNV